MKQWAHSLIVQGLGVEIRLAKSLVQYVWPALSTEIGLRASRDLPTADWVDYG